MAEAAAALQAQITAAVTAALAAQAAAATPVAHVAVPVVDCVPVFVLAVLLRSG